MDLALSVTLTALSTTVAVVVLPPALGLVAGWFETPAIPVEVGPIGAFGRLVFLVLVPIAVGMLARARWAGHLRRWRPWLRLLAGTLVVVVLALAVRRNLDVLADHLATALSLGIGFTLGAMIMGVGCGWLLRADPTEQVTLGIEFAVRNLPIAFLLATAMIGDAGLIAFATAYFVVHAPTVLSVAWCLRRRIPQESVAQPCGQGAAELPRRVGQG